MCELHGEQNGKICPLCPSVYVPPISSDKVWNDAIDASYTSKVRTILIDFSDALGYDDSPKHRNAWNKAFGDLVKLFRNI